MGMQAAVSADGRTVCVLIRRLNSSCSRSTTLVVRRDALATAPTDQPIDLAP